MKWVLTAGTDSGRLTETASPFPRDTQRIKNKPPPSVGVCLFRCFETELSCYNPGLELGVHPLVLTKGQPLPTSVEDRTFGAGLLLRRAML